MYLLLRRLGSEAGGEIELTELDDRGTPAGLSDRIAPADLAERVRLEEARSPRWVWSDTRQWYPSLLAAGQTVQRCIDLLLCHRILRGSPYTAGSALAASRGGAWDATLEVEVEGELPGRLAPQADALFELDTPVSRRRAERSRILEGREADALAELVRQLDALDASADAARLRLLLVAESTGALIAQEMPAAGMPWSAVAHDRILTEILGPRPAARERPAELEVLAAQIRDALDDPQANPDSPVELLKSLGRAGITVSSTSRWELREVDHPVIPPLMEYKKRARLFTANGWNWLDQWVVDGRFRPEYVVGGVVTGRWATSGGGALQLPKEIRAAAVADDGWKLVVADASQVEPRILAAMAGDSAMMRAAAAGDLYQAMVDSGAVAQREHGKIAMLGAMYGATTGESGRLLPQLTRAFPKAIELTEQAARAGERGEVVSTWLGRGSPRPGAESRAAEEAAYGEAATRRDQDRAMSRARAWGRFTRNYVVQGTAAEWAMCWMGALRRRLAALVPASEASPWPGRLPHLVLFVHDEVIVHAPAELADAVAEAIRESAAEAGRLLFGAAPVVFPVTVAIVDDYGAAK